MRSVCGERFRAGADLFLTGQKLLDLDSSELPSVEEMRRIGLQMLQAARQIRTLSNTVRALTDELLAEQELGVVPPTFPLVREVQS